jgi:hypothetical protein
MADKVIRPGDTVVHKGKFWLVRGTELRVGQGMTDFERWAHLVQEDYGKVLHTKWVRWRELEVGDGV